MGKYAQYEKQHFEKKNRKTAKRLKEFIHSIPGDDSKPYCKLCKWEIRAHSDDFTDHERNSKNKQKSSPLSFSRAYYDIEYKPKWVDSGKKTTELKAGKAYCVTFH